MGASLLVLKNKSDVSDCLSEDEIREVSCGWQLREVLRISGVHPPTDGLRQGLQLDRILTHKWHILPCSAITDMNLQEGLAWVVQDAKDRLFLY
jgi:ADP-ribosylation factor-like protein 2